MTGGPLAASLGHQRVVVHPPGQEPRWSEVLRRVPVGRVVVGAVDVEEHEPPAPDTQPQHVLAAPRSGSEHGHEGVEAAYLLDERRQTGFVAAGRPARRRGAQS